MRIPNISHSLIDYEINPKAFINAHNFPTFKDLIDEIKRIDNDSYAFESMLKEPVFLNNFNPHEFYITRVTAFLNHIITQGPDNARRCGEGICIKKHKDFSDIDFVRYCVKHKKTIQTIRDISEFPRNFIRSLRKK